MDEPGRGKALTFYIIIGVGAVQVGRIVLFGHTVIGRAVSIGCLIVMALLARDMISRQRRAKR